MTDIALLEEKVRILDGAIEFLKGENTWCQGYAFRVRCEYPLLHPVTTGVHSLNEVAGIRRNHPDVEIIQACVQGALVQAAEHDLGQSVPSSRALPRHYALELVHTELTVEFRKQFPDLEAKIVEYKKQKSLDLFSSLTSSYRDHCITSIPDFNDHVDMDKDGCVMAMEKLSGTYHEELGR